ncbi:MAG: TolC family protein [Verrucomicrobiales bacterium]|nr:TolC family protein [Verrucomicrobiales bacterium]
MINDSASVFKENYEPVSEEEQDRDLSIDETIGGFLSEAVETGVRESLSPAAERAANSGSVYLDEWWADSHRDPMLNVKGKAVGMQLDEIYTRTLANSSQVRVFAALPLIRETAIDEAKAEFDPESYVESRYNFTDEPTGSTLETGSANDFFRERGWTMEAGVRKKFLAGTEVVVAQDLGQKSNNSEFFIPGDQGNARLRLSVVQPLLKGAGAKYNRTMMQIAKLDAETGYEEFVRQLETHLMEVNRSYWALYLARAMYQEQKNLVNETRGVADELAARGTLDASSSQISRTQAALASREATLVRSELAIMNSESRLRALVNDPWFVTGGIGEIIPSDMPMIGRYVPDFETMVDAALTYRPEIRQAEKHLQASDLREAMARNEKKPTLNLLAETGLSSLRGSGDTGGAFGDQFQDSVPNWGVGVMASVPWGRRAEKARHLRTELEVRQMEDQLRSTMDTVLLEVQVAHREVSTAYPDMKAKYKAAKAAEEELAVLNNRRGLDVQEGEALYLEKLLDAQERRSLARESFLKSLVVYNSAITNLDRASGTLLQAEDVGVHRDVDEDELPILRLTKDEAAKNAIASYALK